MTTEKTITVNAYESPPKDKDGNLKKDDKGKTVKGKLLGTDTTYEFSTDQAGLDAAVKRYTVKKVVINLNRMFATDCRNAIASEAKRDSDPEKKIKRDIAKTSKKLNETERADLNSKLAEILAQYEKLDKE